MTWARALVCRAMGPLQSEMDTIGLALLNPSGACRLVQRRSTTDSTPGFGSRQCKGTWDDEKTNQ